MKAVLILITVAIIISLIAVVITYFWFQKGDSELLDSKTKDIDTQKKCKYCSQMIELSAKVCQHCGRYQRSILNFLLFIPLVMAFIAGIQLFQAHQKTVGASEALNVATAAADDIKKIQTEINIAQDEINFSLLLTRAANDGRFAFDELHAIETTEGHRFQEAARQAVEQIITNEHIVLVLRGNMNWKKHSLDPEKATLNELKKMYDDVSSVDKFHVLGTIWLQKRIPKAEKLEFTYQIITTTPSQRILCEACRLMNSEAKLGKVSLLDYELYVKWWEENRENYPEDQPTPTEQEQKQ